MKRIWFWKVPSDFAEKLSLTGPTRADALIVRALEAGEGSWIDSEPLPAAPSRSLIQKLIEEGLVRSDANPIRAHSRPQAGAEIRIEFPEPRSMELIPENRPLEFLFEDEHLVILNKPPGLTVHPSETQLQGTLVHALLHHIRDLSGIGGVLRPGIVHRLDKDTSGALVVSKTDEAHRALVETFSKHEIEREYWALCYGSPGLRRGETRVIDTLIGRNPTDRKKMSAEVKSGRRAISRVRELESFALTGKRPFASLMGVRLETGRTHQVRVHLTGMGHSLLGDPMYGTPSSRHTKWLALPPQIRKLVEALPGQALHARVLGFQHPVTGKSLRFEAEPPPAFAALLEGLRATRS